MIFKAKISKQKTARVSAKKSTIGKIVKLNFENIDETLNQVRTLKVKGHASKKEN